MRRCLLMLRSIGRSLLPILFTGMVVGCVSAPRAEFLHIACNRVPRGGDLQAVSFSSSIKTHGLAGQQVIYQVGVVDSRLRPLRSANNRFQNAAGDVAASKALMVHESPWTFEDVSVTIPTAELEIHAHDLPVLAEFSVCLPNGECLVQETTVLPVYSATRPHRMGPRLKPEPRVVAKTRRPRKSATDKQRTAGSQPFTQRTKSSKTVSERRLATSKPADRFATGPESGRPTHEAVHPSDWRRAMLTGVEARLAHAVHGLFPFDPLFAITERAERRENRPQKPASRPTTRPSPLVGVEDHLPVVVTATPARELNEQRPGDDKKPSWRRYVVQSGDTLSHIAQRFLGDSSRWHEIYELNQDQLASPDDLTIGLELRLPSDDEEPTSKDPER